MKLEKKIFDLGAATMNFEQIANKIVDKLNAENIPQNDYDRYELNHWYGGYAGEFHQAVIYHSGGRCTDKPWGTIAWTNANDKCRDYDTACKKMIAHYLTKTGSKITFSTPNELEMKLSIEGVI